MAGVGGRRGKEGVTTGGELAFVEHLRWLTMAWCESCRRYLTPAVLTVKGGCPSCGADVEHPSLRDNARTTRKSEVAMSSGSSVRSGDSVRSDGSSPAFGSVASDGSSPAGGSADAVPQRIPWHFWLLLAAAIVYLGWRALQGVALLLTIPGVSAMSGVAAVL